MREFLAIGALVFSALAQAGPDVFEKLDGIWGESRKDCAENPHRISFSEDRQVMVVSYGSVGYATPGDVRESFRYIVGGVGDYLLLVRMEGENRFDEKGNPVLWRLILLPDEISYCWHREDWPSGECTTPRYRCDVTPTEGWGK